MLLARCELRPAVGGEAGAAVYGALLSFSAGLFAGEITRGLLSLRRGSGTRGASQIRRVEIGGLEAVSRMQLMEFGIEIASNPRANSLYGQVARHGVEVDLSFAPIRRTPDGNIIAGYFDPYPAPGRIKIYARAQSSMGEAIGTFGHEARHVLDSTRRLPLNTRGSEYRAFVEEFLVRQGRVPTRMEMGVLAREVNRLYRHLSTDARVTRISRY